MLDAAFGSTRARPLSARSAVGRRLAAAAIALIAASTGAQGASAVSGRSALVGLPAATADIMSAARVISEAPFQRFLVLACTGGAGNSVCRTRLAPALARERVVIQFASCIASTTQGGEMGSIDLFVTDNPFTTLFAGHFIAPTFRGGAVSHIHIASQPMLLTVDANRLLHVEARPNGGALTLARCGLSGVKQKLG
jgi:hypothetical protein